jgi:hypothetical protein
MSNEHIKWRKPGFSRYQVLGYIIKRLSFNLWLLICTQNLKGNAGTHNVTLQQWVLVFQSINHNQFHTFSKYQIYNLHRVVKT